MLTSYGGYQVFNLVGLDSEKNANSFRPPFEANKAKYEAIRSLSLGEVLAKIGGLVMKQLTTLCH